MTVAAAEAALDATARTLGARVGVDGLALLRERADILGIAPSGTVSAGGTCRLLRAGDGGWVALNLARRGDVDLLAAWMARPLDGPVWDEVGNHLATMTADAAVERAQLLGLPAAFAVEPTSQPEPVRTRPGASARANQQETPLVVDLSALWAGPLAARLLAGLGARVVKVELPGRPDGARGGPPAFWECLNGAKEHRTLDVPALPAMLDAADVVVTSARPRALDQLRLDLGRRARHGGLLWIAISGYGLAGAWRDRVAFGDDAAVAGGLAVFAGGHDAPVFVGDAPADPIAGLLAATAGAALLEAGCGGIVDVSMRDGIAAALVDARYPANIQEVA